MVMTRTRAYRYPDAKVDLGGDEEDLEEDDIGLLISRFDKDNDGRIGLNEVSTPFLF